MANKLFNFNTPFVQGTSVRSSAVNFQFDALQSAFDLTEGILNTTIKLPAGFSGNGQIPDKTVEKTLVYINQQGDVDLYSLNTFDNHVQTVASQHSDVSGWFGQVSNWHQAVSSWHSNIAIYHSDVNQKHTDVVAKHSDLTPKYADFSIKYTDFASKYDDILKAEGYALQTAADAKVVKEKAAIAVSASQEAVSAKAAALYMQQPISEGQSVEHGDMFLVLATDNIELLLDKLFKNIAVGQWFAVSNEGSGIVWLPSIEAKDSDSLGLAIRTKTTLIEGGDRFGISPGNSFTVRVVSLNEVKIT